METPGHDVYCRCPDGAVVAFPPRARVIEHCKTLSDIAQDIGDDTTWGTAQNPIDIATKAATADVLTVLAEFLADMAPHVEEFYGASRLWYTFFDMTDVERERNALPRTHVKIPYVDDWFEALRTRDGGDLLARVLCVCDFIECRIYNFAACRFRARQFCKMSVQQIRDYLGITETGFKPGEQAQIERENEMIEKEEWTHTQDNDCGCECACIDGDTADHSVAVTH